MSKNKNIPLWPLYLADALMFITVFLMAYPNIETQKEVSFPQALVMILMVGLGMFLLMLPYIIESMTEIKIAKMNMLRSDAEYEEQFKSLSSDMRQLRTAVVEQKEDTAMNNESISDLTRKFGDRMAVLKQQSKDILEMREDLTNIVAQFSSTSKELKSELSGILKKLEFLSKEYDSLKVSKVGIVAKAFSNSQENSTKSAVSKFIEKSRVEKLEKEDSFDEVFEDDKDDEIIDEEKVEVGDIEESIESKDDFNTKDKSDSEGIDISYDAGKEGIKEGDELFSSREFESEGKAKIAKGKVTSVILDAFVGIGNKPYIRGNGGGLSDSEGIAMNLIEIGRWQWVAKGDIEDSISFSLWLNDEVQSEEKNFILNPNETLEIQANF